MHKRRTCEKKTRAKVENAPQEQRSRAILPERRGGGLLPRELEPNMHTAGVLLVAVESGANLPSWTARCQDRFSDVFVLAGIADEPADALLRRVEQRLSLLNPTSTGRGFAILVTERGPISTAAEIARLRLAQAMLGHLARLRQGTLLLLTDEDASHDCRAQLLSMVGNLSQQLRGTDISVSVRFGTLTLAEPPADLFKQNQPSVRKASRRPPPKSGQMLKHGLVPPLSKGPAVLVRRKVGEAS